jgi:hypothetical protein
MPSFFSEHPAALPSPPVRKLRLGRAPDVTTFTRPPFRCKDSHGTATLTRFVGTDARRTRDHQLGM